MNHKEVQIEFIENLINDLATYHVEATPAKIATAKGHLADFLAKRMDKLSKQVKKAKDKNA